MRAILLALLLVSIAFAFILGFVAREPLVVEVSATPTQAVFVPTASPFETGTRSLSLALPAVDRLDRGTLAQLTVRVQPGTGGVFMQADGASPLINPDTQTSLRLAADLSRQHAGEGAYAYDVFYSLETPSDVVGGRSAGAAAAVLTTAALRGVRVRPGVVITGTVDAQGVIGKVGKILEKAVAVRDRGYSTFLVPVGEGIQNKLVEQCTQRSVNGAVVRQCQTLSVPVNVSEETGLNVVEVKNVAEALARMLD